MFGSDIKTGKKRLEAVKELDDQEILIDLAQNDPDKDVREAAVKKEYRKRGIAYNIITELEKIVIENRFRYSYIITGKNNNAAIKLYEKLNYKLIDNFGQFINDDTVICMKKEFK